MTHRRGLNTHHVITARLHPLPGARLPRCCAAVVPNALPQGARRWAAVHCQHPLRELAGGRAQQRRVASLPVCMVCVGVWGLGVRGGVCVAGTDMCQAGLGCTARGAATCADGWRRHVRPNMLPAWQGRGRWHKHAGAACLTACGGPSSHVCSPSPLCPAASPCPSAPAARASGARWRSPSAASCSPGRARCGAVLKQRACVCHGGTDAHPSSPPARMREPASAYLTRKAGGLAGGHA